MKHAGSAFLAFCLLSMASAASAQAVPPAPPPAPSSVEAGSRQARALVLARLMVPEDLVVQQEIRLAKQDYRRRTNANPRSRRLEATYPGIHMSVWAEVEPELRRLAAEGKPSLWARQADRLQSLLTADETEKLITFYSTSIGRKIIRATIESVDSYPDDRRPIPAPDQRKVAAVADGLGDLTPEDEAALLAAHRVVGGDKLRRIGEEMARVAQRWRLQSEPLQQSRGDRIISAAIARHIAKRRPRR